MSPDNKRAPECAPRGKLYLVPVPLDHGCDQQVPAEDVIPLGTLRHAAKLTHWISESAKSTRAFLKRVGALTPLAQPIQSMQISELPREIHKKGDHTDTRRAQFDARPMLAPALDGADMGLASEAGMPGVADPGSSIVRAAHELGIEVVPLVGPVSMLLALAASGLNGQNFAFVGYLPQEAAARSQRIRELESLSRKTGQTQLFIETPYRNSALFQALVETLRDDSRLTIACGLTLPSASIRTLTAGQWKRRSPDSQGAQQAMKLPCVFAIGN